MSLEVTHDGDTSALRELCPGSYLGKRWTCGACGSECDDFGFNEEVMRARPEVTDADDYFACCRNLKCIHARGEAYGQSPSSPYWILPTGVDHIQHQARTTIERMKEDDDLAREAIDLDRTNPELGEAVRNGMNATQRAAYDRMKAAQ